MRRCLAMLLLGCGHAAPAPAPTPPQHATRPPPDAAPVDAPAVALDQDLPRLAARAVQMFQAWQHALVEAGTDCAAAAAKVNAVADQYADVIAANAKVLAAGHERVQALKAALAPHDAEMDAAAAGIVHAPAMAKCSTDPAFAHAIDRIGGAPP